MMVLPALCSTWVALPVIPCLMVQAAPAFQALAVLSIPVTVQVRVRVPWGLCHLIMPMVVLNHPCLWALVAPPKVELVLALMRARLDR